MACHSTSEILMMKDTLCPGFLYKKVHTGRRTKVMSYIQSHLNLDYSSLFYCSFTKEKMFCKERKNLQTAFKSLNLTYPQFSKVFAQCYDNFCATQHKYFVKVGQLSLHFIFSMLCENTKWVSPIEKQGRFC